MHIVWHTYRDSESSQFSWLYTEFLLQFEWCSLAMRIPRKAIHIESFHLVTLIIISIIVTIDCRSAWNNITCPTLCLCPYILSKWVNETVRRVDCSMKGFRRIPRDIPSHCQSLVLTGNRISDIHQQISSLEHLLELDLSSNSINQLGRGHTFFNLIHLKYLNLSNNSFKTLFPGVFRGLKRLEKLIITNGQLRYIDEHAFDGLESLRELYLQNNQITSIFLELFQSICNLHILNLNGNNISRLTGGIFASLNGLRHLSVCSNQLNVIDDNSLVGLDMLEDIYLCDNHLTKVPSIALQSLKRVRSIDLSGNLLPSLQTGDFVHLPVRSIIINHCPTLVMIERMSFWDLPDLTSIQLSHNVKLEYIDPQAFLSVTRLNSIELESNSLLTLDSDLVNNIVHRGGHQSHLSLSLNNNPFLCDCNIHFLHQCLTSSGNLSKINLTESDSLTCSYPGNLSSIRIKDLDIKSIPNECEPTILSSSSSQPNQTIHRRVGERAVFMCRAIGRPTPKIYWILPSGEIFNESSNTAHIQLKSPGILRLYHLRSKDSGQYTCIAENGVGSVSTSFSLNVDDIDIQIWPLGVSSTFVSVVWNGTTTSHITPSSPSSSPSPLSSHHHHLPSRSFPEYQILYKEEDDPSDRYESISVGHFLRSYTINHLEPRKRYKLCIAVRDTEANKGYVQLSCTLVTTSPSDNYMLDSIRDTSYIAIALTLSLTAVALVILSFTVLGARRLRQRQYETPQKSLVNNMDPIPLAQLPLVPNQSIR